LEDRERIGRDLHDTVIQRLFATGMSLQGTARLVRGEPDEALARIESAIDDLDLTVKHIRTAIFGLERTRPTSEGLRSRVLAIAPASAVDASVDSMVCASGHSSARAAISAAIAGVASDASPPVARRACRRSMASPSGSWHRISTTSAWSDAARARARRRCSGS